MEGKEVYIVYGDGHYVVEGVFSTFKKVKKCIKLNHRMWYPETKKLSEAEFIAYARKFDVYIQRAKYN